jgi:hypothetical protein
VQADEYLADPLSYRSVLAQLKAGDVLRLSPGIYRDGLPLADLHGTRARPVVIEGPAAGPPAILLARERHNTVSLRRVSHVVIRNLVLDGANLAVDAVKAERDGGLVHNITIEGLTVIRHGIDQGIVAISTKCPAAFWTIRNNRIVAAGTGMYLGDSDGTAPFVAGVIEGNLVVDTLGYNLQVKHQRARPEIEGLPASPQSTVIRGNFFSKSVNANTGTLARPNLLLGHFPLDGLGHSDTYLVTANVFFSNPVESLMQAEGNVIIAKNAFINLDGDGIAVQPHNDVPRRIEIAGNFVVASGHGIRVRGADTGYAQVITGNREFTGVQISSEAFEVPFQNWLTTEFAPNNNLERFIHKARHMACKHLAGSSPPAQQLRARYAFLCQQL